MDSTDCSCVVRCVSMCVIISRIKRIKCPNCTSHTQERERRGEKEGGGSGEFIGTYIGTHAYIYIYICTFTFTHSHTHIHTFIFTHMHTKLNISLFLFIPHDLEIACEHTCTVLRQLSTESGNKNGKMRRASKSASRPNFWRLLNNCNKTIRKWRGYIYLDVNILIHTGNHTRITKPY